MDGNVRDAKKKIKCQLFKYKIENVKSNDQKAHHLISNNYLKETKNIIFILVFFLWTSWKNLFLFKSILLKSCVPFVRGSRKF